MFLSVLSLWRKSSIATKVVLLVGSILFHIIIHTYLSVVHINHTLTPLVHKELRGSAEYGHQHLSQLVQQSFEDIEILSVHNDLRAYLEYEMLDDVLGMKKSAKQIEAFLLAVTESKQQYQEIEIVSSLGTVIHYYQGEVFTKRNTSESAPHNIDDINAFPVQEFFEENGQYYLAVNLHFNTKSILTDNKSSDVRIRILSDISQSLHLLNNTLAEENLYFSLSSNGQPVFGDEFIKNSSNQWLIETLADPQHNINIQVKIRREDAFWLISSIKDAAIILAIGSSLLFSVSLFVVSRKVIAKPLKEIINFIEKSIHKEYNLSRRFMTKSEDEIGVFAQGLNNMLDTIQKREQQLIASEERLSLALWAGGEGMWEYSRQQDMFYFDSRSCSILGIKQAVFHLSRTDFFDSIHPLDRARVNKSADKFLTLDSPAFDEKFRIRLQSGDYIWLNVRGKTNLQALDSMEGRDTIFVSGTLRDISETVQSEQEVQLYATAFDSSNNAIIILDIDFKTIAVNKAFSDISGFKPQDVIGNVPLFIKNKTGKNQVDISEINEHISKHGYWHAEVTSIKKNKQSYIREVDLNPVYDNDRQLTHYVCVFVDITDKKASEQELWAMANYDQLTKLPNRGLFKRSLDTVLDSAMSNNRAVSLLFIDLDKFKQVNDSLGHDVGDALLKKVAKKLQKNIRRSDMVARLGGDEFAIILEDADKYENVETVVNKIIKAFDDEFTVKGQSTGVGVSIGVSFFPEDAQTAEQLVNCADTAMYCAKNTGGNAFALYSSSMADHVNRRNMLEKALKVAVDEQSLLLYYQPQYDLTTGKLVSFETLSRWIHPELGFITPDEFIPIAEGSGLIEKMGNQMFRQACEQLKAWHLQGHSDISIAVNISPKQFMLSDLAIDFTTTIAQVGVDPKYVELELTESLIVDDPEQVIDILQTLKSVGVRLSIDDFGTGYSSLSYLSKFPLDVLKIDKSFVNEMCSSEKSLALTQSIIAIAHSLNLKVIAEGVETQDQVNILRKQKCEYAQGYLYARPLPVNDASALLEQISTATTELQFADAS